MQYLGGKSKIARWLAAAMRPSLLYGSSPRPWWDAFCGGLSVSLALADVAPGVGGVSTDANPALAALYRAVASGWDPPASLSEDEYRAARALSDSDPRKAFAGFGCSFGGKWFGGYARAPAQANRTYAGATRTALLRDVGALVAAGVSIAHANFLDVEPEPTDAVLYLDPPYAGTTAYGATGAFDYARFYARVAAWARHTDVFVSEYAMPPDLGGRLAMEFAHDMSVAGGVQKNARVERLYHYAPDLPGPAPCSHAALVAALGRCPRCPEYRPGARRTSGEV
jgi:DNA adenine methylase